MSYMGIHSSHVPSPALTEREEPVKIEILRRCYVFDAQLGAMRSCDVGEIVTTTTTHARSVVVDSAKGRYVAA